MVDKQKIVNYLNNISISNSDDRSGNLIRRLIRGAKVNKSTRYSYKIDNVNADENLGDFPIGAVPYGLIHQTLKSSSSDILAMFKDSDCIPFSRALKAGVGQCLEKAILVQLAAQRTGESYLVKGALELDGDIGADFHAFNLVGRGEYIYLIDAENPIGKDEVGKVTRPYIVPVKEITDKGAIIVPEECRVGRTYFLN